MAFTTIALLLLVYFLGILTGSEDEKSRQRRQALQTRINDLEKSLKDMRRRVYDTESN